MDQYYFHKGANKNLVLPTIQNKCRTNTVQPHKQTELVVILIRTIIIEYVIHQIRKFNE